MKKTPKIPLQNTYLLLSSSYRIALRNEEFYTSNKR